MRGRIFVFPLFLISCCLGSEDYAPTAFRGAREAWGVTSEDLIEEWTATALTRRRERTPGLKGGMKKRKTLCH